MNFLRQERERLGFQGREVYEKIEVSKGTYIRWESGYPIPSDQLAKLDVLGFDVAFVVTGKRSDAKSAQFTWHDVEEAGHGWLSDAVLLEALKIDDRQTYNFLHGLLMRNLTKFTGVKAPESGANKSDLKIG